MINDAPSGLPSAAPTPFSLPRFHSQSAGTPCTHAAYRLSCDEYDAMRQRAWGRCEICDKADDETPRGLLVIDHFQGMEVWFVRGLLCDRCNAVMQRHDGMAPWGPATRPFLTRARAYHLCAFGEPDMDVLDRADEVIRDRVRALAAHFEAAPEPGPPRLDDLLGPNFTV
ncbi:endonuclease domain-containing protein [Streptomyces sp. NPDC012617]|uniref:endonuclease domain-containing protein n=1 Tax=Streptomyces TaxID=1883 RepID=UPI0033C1F00C